ncbi:helix-turn-helix domain-containing protein [Paenibacillus sepulcri]|uniref:AraC family transcriptional regulator n=1 Tax=Paenibacillus sepulcri TaxID=359917 RepID=A0ABS7BW51_9BACL|nr:AraC family transcriptional regulator [Paenibacillus sepulcri]
MSKQPNMYFLKILLFGVIIGSLPVITIGIFSYFKASHTIQINANHSKQQNLFGIQNSVEQVLKTTDHSLTYFVNSALLIDTLTEPLTVTQFKQYNQIRKELTHLQTFDTGISDIILLSQDKGWFIDNVGLYRLDQIKDADRFTRYLDLPFDSVWMVDSPINNSAASDNCQSNIQLIKKLPINSMNKKGLAITQIPVCYLGKMFSYDVANESVMIVDQNQQIFLEANPTLLKDVDVKLSVLDPISDLVPSSGQFQINNHSTEFTVTYQKSDYNGWIYLSFISIKELTKESRAIGWFTAVICIVLLLAALITAWIVTKRIYNPIKKLFHFSSELEGQLQTQTGQLKILFMFKLFQGGLGSKEISEKLQSLGFTDSYEQLSVITIQIDTLEGTRYDDNDLDLLLFAINNIIEELIAEHRRLTPVVIDQSQTTILLNNAADPDKLKEDIYLLAQDIQLTIFKYLHVDVSIGISLPFLDLSTTQQAYQESIEALKNRIRLGDKAIIYYQELPQGGYPIHTFFPSKVQNELSDAIKLADREEVDKLLALFYLNLSNNHMGPKEYEIWTTRLLIDFIQLTHSLGIQYLPFTDNQSVFERMFKLRTTKEIKVWLRQSVIEPIIVAIEERTLSQYKNISEQIIMIIQEDFDKEISLDSIAARMHYNPNYLSSVFRKEVGIPFSEYLAVHRHSKAIRYLVETTMSIKEISEKLQYNNSQNFIRSFRKIEGITPGKYRQDRQTG